MSAIYGCFSRIGGMVLGEQSQVMSAALDAYGLDGNRVWHDEKVLLGCQYMAISPNSNRDVLPKHNTASALVLTADLRLDNRQALSKQIGISFKELSEISDSSLILKAYQRWGTDCPKYLLGDYAFAIWDPKKRTLFCARDHIGTRPFYYSLSAERFIFASDINGVLAHPKVSNQFDDAYLAAKLQDKFFFNEERTFFANIHKLPPGHTITVLPDTIQIKRHWFPEHVSEIYFKSDTDYTAAFLEIFTQAVRDRVQSDYPIGVHLSGGLDSSSVAVLSARELRRQNKALPAAFAWLPPPTGDIPPQSEYSRIQSVCDQEGLALHYQPSSPQDYIRLFQRDGTREPTEMTLAVEELIQKKANALGIRVILSGWGGDEGVAFNGRGYFPTLFLQGRWGKLIQESTGNPLNFFFQKVLFPFLPYRAFRKAINSNHLKDLFETQSYINLEFAQRALLLKSNPYYATHMRKAQLQVLTYGFLADRMADWFANGARYNIVYHYPLLDKRVLEFALGLPADKFRRNSWRRWFMRNAMDNILPEEVCWNRDKTDPIRIQSSKTSLAEALAQIGQTLAGLPVPPSRASYLDYPSLLRDLTTGFDINNPKHGKVRTPLQFLDW